MKKSSEKSHCSIKTMPMPVTITCGECGYEIEAWTDEDEAVCPSCGVKILRQES